jgi:hypothetical protein
MILLRHAQDSNDYGQVTRASVRQTVYFAKQQIRGEGVHIVV